MYVPGCGLHNRHINNMLVIAKSIYRKIYQKKMLVLRILLNLIHVYMYIHSLSDDTCCENVDWKFYSNYRKEFSK